MTSDSIPATSMPAQARHTADNRRPFLPENPLTRPDAPLYIALATGARDVRFHAKRAFEPQGEGKMTTITYRLRAATLLLVSLGALGSGGLLTNHFAAWAIQASGAPNSLQDNKALADAETIRNLIKELGDEAFEKREAADKALAAIGEPALELLKKAAVDSPDAEVRQRAGQLANKIVANKFAEVRRFEGHAKETKAQATCVAVTPDGRQIVSAGSLFLRSWDVETGKQIQSFGELQKPFYRALSVSADFRPVEGRQNPGRRALFRHGRQRHGAAMGPGEGQTNPRPAGPFETSFRRCLLA